MCIFGISDARSMDRELGPFAVGPEPLCSGIASPCFQSNGVVLHYGHVGQ